MIEPSTRLMQRYEVPGAPAVVLFGGNPHRRDAVVRFLGPALGVTVVGTLSEAEGIATLEALGERVGAVVIGGRYDEAQRRRIRAFVARTLPGIHVAEPGVAFAYDDGELVADLARALEASATAGDPS
ncbi:MAG: hypothetical protein MUC96_04440 [Myxococcaceae bacterium]|jgi:hypothetical protein|nr:hypothetical protein [Myxococcaceae bacterium]